MSTQNSVKVRMWYWRSLQVACLPFIVMLILSSATAMSFGSLAANAGENTGARSCIPEGEGLSIQEGAEMFRLRGYLPRQAGKIQRPGDMVGSIMFMGKPGHWLY